MSPDGVDRRRPRTAGLGPAAPLTITEGTNIAVRPSSDGKRLAFDLYGVIWTIPVTGGVATRLTDDFSDGRCRTGGPNGETVAFQSYRDGNYHIYTVGSDGKGLTQLTNGPFDSPRAALFARRQADRLLERRYWSLCHSRPRRRRRRDAGLGEGRRPSLRAILVPGWCANCVRRRPLQGGDR